MVDTPPEHITTCTLFVRRKAWTIFKQLQQRNYFLLRLTALAARNIGLVLSSYPGTAFKLCRSLKSG